jgi:hypothetical protein
VNYPLSNGTRAKSSRNEVDFAEVNRKRAESAKSRGTVQKQSELSIETKRKIFQGIGLGSEVGFTILPAGIDMVCVEAIVRQASFNRQLRVTPDEWIPKPRTDKKTKQTGESYFIHSVKDKKGNQLFYLQLYRGICNDGVGGRGVDAWILRVQFNPSRFMYLTAGKGAVQGENYVAGNSVAFQLAMEKLEEVLGGEVLNQLQGMRFKRLDISDFGLRQVHLTRDYLLHHVYRKFRRKYGWHESSDFWDFYSRATWENKKSLDILGLFANSSPLRIRRYDTSLSKEYTLLEDHIKDLRRKSPKRVLEPSRRAELNRLKKRMSAGENTFGSPVNYILRGTLTRREVFYVKERYNKKLRFEGAAPRFELKLLKGDDLKDLGVSDLTGLHQLLLDVDVWHQGGCVGTLPLIEAQLNRRLQEFNGILGESRDKANLRFFPKLTQDFIDLLLKLEDAVYEAHRTVRMELTVSQPEALETPSKIDYATLLPNFTPRSSSTSFNLDNDHEIFLDYIRTHLRAGVSPYLPEREQIDCLLREGIKWLKPMKLHSMMGQTTGFLDSENQPTKDSGASERYVEQRALVSYFLDSYDGNFQGLSEPVGGNFQGLPKMFLGFSKAGEYQRFSKNDERELVIEQLMARRQIPVT